MSHYDDIYLHDTAREDDTQERIDARVQELLADRDAVLEADSWVAGTLDYDGLETALADLHTLPIHKWLDSDAMTLIARMGRQAYTARMAKLTEQAEADVAEAAAFRPDMGRVA